MKKIMNKGVLSLEVPDINHKIITAGFSTRQGGVSTDCYSSMNLRFNSEDDPLNIKKNYEKFSSSIDVNMNQVVLSDQVHLAEILKVDHQHKGMGYAIESSFKGVDGLITNETDICLMTFHADCIPIYFYDLKNKVIGLAHGGWQGTLKEISKRMIEMFLVDYHVKLEDIQVFVGPGVCQSCYEVSDELINQFKEKNPCDEFYQGKDQRHLDLKAVHKYQLILSGVPEKNINVSSLCTCCDKELFYSHRRDGHKRGGHVAYIMLKNEK